MRDWKTTLAGFAAAFCLIASQDGDLQLKYRRWFGYVTGAAIASGLTVASDRKKKDEGDAVDKPVRN